MADGDLPATTKENEMKIQVNMGAMLIAAYIIGGFATFGYLWNNTPGVDRCYVDNGVQHDCFTDYSDRATRPLIAGLLWPGYWGGAISIRVFANK